MSWEGVMSHVWEGVTTYRRERESRLMSEEWKIIQMVRTFSGQTHFAPTFHKLQQNEIFNQS